MKEKTPKTPAKMIGWMAWSMRHGLSEMKTSNILATAIKRWPEKFSKSR